MTRPAGLWKVTSNMKTTRTAFRAPFRAVELIHLDQVLQQILRVAPEKAITLKSFTGLRNDRPFRQMLPTEATRRRRLTHQPIITVMIEAEEAVPLPLAGVAMEAAVLVDMTPAALRTTSASPKRQAALNTTHWATI